MVDLRIPETLGELARDEKIIYKLLYIEGLEEELIKRKEALAGRTEADESVVLSRIEAAMSEDTKTKCVCHLKAENEAAWLLTEKGRVDEAFKKIPEELQRILNELCVEQYTWRYLKTIYLSYRKISEMKALALKEIGEMIEES